MKQFNLKNLLLPPILLIAFFISINRRIKRNYEEEALLLVSAFGRKRNNGERRKAKPVANFFYDEEVEEEESLPLQKRVNVCGGPTEGGVSFWDRRLGSAGASAQHAQVGLLKSRTSIRNFEQGGKLHIDTIGNKNNVYLFCSTENEYDDVVIPTLVAVVSPSLPSLEIAIRTSRNDFKEIVPLKKMKMDWIPRVSPSSKHDIPRTRIFVLGCTQRRAALSRIEEGRFEQFRYCMPYVFNTFESNPVNQTRPESDEQLKLEAEEAKARRAVFKNMRIYNQLLLRPSS